MTRIFATGVTGYIGGDALTTIIEAHPDWQYTFFVRDSDKGAKVAARWPSVTLVYGKDWASAVNVLEEEAAKADVVLHFHADSTEAASALLAGLSRSETPKHYIHTSGTGILCYADTDRDSYGVASSLVFDDLDGIDAIRNLPDHAEHRQVDKLVLSAGSSGKVHTAIVSPPCIYGEGRGPDNTTSMQLPRLISLSLSRGKAFRINAGANIWSHVHISDLSALYLLLTEAAAGYVASGTSGPANAGKATWNDLGYYFAEAGECSWGEVSERVAKEGKEKGLWESEEVEVLEPPVANALRKGSAFGLGTNSRSRARRARELLGWAPKGPGLLETVGEALEVERKRAGVGHARIAAGDA